MVQLRTLALAVVAVVFGIVCQQGVVEAFVGVALTPATTKSHTCSQNRLHMTEIMKPRSVTIGRKMKLVDNVKAKLTSKTTLIFAVPSENITANQMVKLRKNIPRSSSISVVKNTLMKRAVEGTAWDVITEEMYARSNMWLFVEEEYAATLKALDELLKEPNVKEKNDIRHGVMEGKVINSVQVIAISKLPSKQELYERIAISIKMIPTRLAGSIKAVPEKLAVAIKMATVDKMEEEAQAASA